MYNTIAAGEESAMLQDFMVPNQVHYCAEMIVGVSKRQQSMSSSCGKQKQVILKQLVELFRRDFVIDDGGVATRNGVGVYGGGQVMDALMTQSLQQQEEEVPFTSLLMMQSNQVDMKESDKSVLGKCCGTLNPVIRALRFLSSPSSLLFVIQNFKDKYTHTHTQKHDF